MWTQETYLMWFNPTTSEYEKLICIKSYPDLGGAPEQIETTTMCEVESRTYIKGLTDPGNLEFTANYTWADFQRLLQLSKMGEQTYALFFGSAKTPDTPDFTEGAVFIPGELAVWLNGHGVQEVRELTISISPTRGILYEDPEGVVVVPTPNP